MTARLVVLVSNAGTTLQALLDASTDVAYGAQVVAVGSDRPGVGGLHRAGQAGVPTFTLRVADYPSRADWDKALTESCASFQPDLIVSAGFMKLAGATFLGQFGGRFINSHPALLPSFPGMHGVRDALEYGVKVTGCTIFMVDAGIDTGPVIAQAAVPVQPGDDEASLHERIKLTERTLLADTVGRMAREGVDRPRQEVEVRPLTKVAIKRALISVYDKTGLTSLAQALHDSPGAEIVSTGSTAAAIAAAGLPVTRVEDVTGFPECLDGRVKTLHPAVHAGLLADPGRPEHTAQLAELGFAPFELLVSNLYPFEQAVAAGSAPGECVEQIDIGGPAMTRAAAKNHARVAVVTDPSMYAAVTEALAAGGFTLEQRRRLAAQAYARTAAYDAAVASWFASSYAPDPVAVDTGWPDTAAAAWTRRDVLRYGENPHQRAALYVSSGGGAGGIAGAEQLHGKAMSYNNYVDADAARRAAFDFAAPCVAIMKHSNPCGIATGADLAEAHRKANACDPESAFGGVIGANQIVTADLAAQIAEVFTEVVIAPGFDPAALDILAGRKNVRLLVCPPPSAGAGVEWRPVSGGMLMQSADRAAEPGDDPANWALVAGPAVTGDVLADLAFGWKACRSVKSNAILLASGSASVGIGMGQVNRVDAARLAVRRAGDRARGSVGASDAYFPFPDGLQVLADAGVTAVAEPGGSVRDQLVIDAASAAGLTLYFTGVRHFFH